MPCVWLPHNNKQLFINVAIVAPAVIDAVNQNKDPGRVEMFKALVDTGATSTCITKAVADKVGLVPIGKVPVHGVAGVSYHNNYLFHVGFTFQQPLPVGTEVDAKAPKPKWNAHFLADPIQGAELKIGGDAFQVLLGMDVIASGALVVNGNGSASFSF